MSNDLQLVTATHKLGSKIEIARQMGSFKSIGEDLVALVADEIVATGAEPNSFINRIPVEKYNAEQIASILIGVRKGCLKAGISQVDGEITEPPKLLEIDGIDISASAIGRVGEENKLGSHRVREGDVIVAMPASGMHANGFSLVNQIIATQELDLSRNYDFNKSLGEILLTPSEIYTLDCLALIKSQLSNLRAFTHIRRGGLAENTARVIPEELTAIYDRSTWSLPLEMKFLADIAGTPESDVERTWNTGIGMSAIVDPTVADLIIRSLAARGMKAWIAGTVEKAAEMGAPRSYLVSQYR